MHALVLYIELTCTVAFGSQAIGMKNLSFQVNSVPNTARNEAISLSKSPISNTAIPKPVTHMAKV